MREILSRIRSKKNTYFEESDYFTLSYPLIEHVNCDVLGVALANMVQQKTSILERLILWGLTWSMLGMRTVLQAVSNSAVKELVLEDSEIVNVDCDVLGAALADMIQHNKQLRVLCLNELP
jgi:Na+-translocating ferredoxin:NAD+ oxidoreductase RnfA subunit